MKSKYAGKFNHDEDAFLYDEDVLNEENPIRNEYEQALNWTANQIERDSSVLELGSGTGNLTIKMKQAKKLVCVDISDKMTEIAKPKTRNQTNIKFIKSDILEFFENNTEKFDYIVSTYSIHHLTEEEKLILFDYIYDNLKENGKAIFTDLMFENEEKKMETVSKYRLLGRNDIVKAIYDEFFWMIDRCKTYLEEIGFKIGINRFSEFSWGIIAEKHQL
jgi:putative AdoMet-dependent methyltransferase